MRGSVQENGVDGVVLIMIEITDDLVPNERHFRSTYVRLEKRLLQLDPARGKERLMKIQQHDGVVVDAAGSWQGFAKRKRGGEVLRREREVPRAGVRLPSLPPLYIGALGAAVGNMP